MIRTEVAHLRAAGATLFAIACVTMHAYLPAIRGVVAPTEWISLPDVAAEQVVALGSKRPLLLGSPTTARKQVLALPLEARGVTPVLLGLEDEQRLVAVIHALVGGAPESSVLPVLRELEAAAASRGADSLVLGCTELSPFASALSRLPAVDPLDAAARAICARAALRLRE